MPLEMHLSVVFCNGVQHATGDQILPYVCIIYGMEVSVLFTKYGN